MTEQRIVVIDNGSYKLKCGYAGDEYPISYRSTVIYESKLKSTHNAIGTTSILGPNGLRQLKRPMEHRYKPDYDGLEQIWRKTFDETLKIDTRERDVIMTEVSLNPKINREKTCEIMFEEFDIGRFFLGNQSVFSLFATGSESGIVINSGFEATNVVPIVDGMSVPNATQLSMIGGNDVTNYMMYLLAKEGFHPKNYAEFRLFNMAKDEQCFFKDFAFANSLRPNQKRENMETSFNRGYYEEIKLGDIATQCPEVIFKPSLMTKDVKPIHQLFVDSYNSIGDNLKDKCSFNIVLSGANTMIGGFAKRLDTEVYGLTKTHFHFKAPKQRDLLSWIGASIFASTDNMESQWITSGEYLDSGPQIINRKCLM